jgi:toxin ParE1/3/4
MALIIWTEPAITDLDAIGDYIALDKPDAARALIKRVIEHVEQLAQYPESGSHPAEIGKSRYRQIVEPPCRVIYRHDRDRVFILSIIRGEMPLKKTLITKRDRNTKPS